MNKSSDFDRRFYNPFRWIAAGFCFLVKHEKPRWLLKTKRIFFSICITHHPSPITHRPSPIAPPISFWCYSNPIVATRINVFGNTRLFKMILPFVATRNMPTFLLTILAIHSPVCGYAQHADLPIDNISHSFPCLWLRALILPSR